MTSTTTLYRNTHPEYREKERVIRREKEYIKYNNDEAFREKKKQQALANYYKKKELKQQQQALQAH